MHHKSPYPCACQRGSKCALQALHLSASRKRPHILLTQLPSHINLATFSARSTGITTIILSCAVVSAPRMSIVPLMRIRPRWRQSSHFKKKLISLFGVKCESRTIRGCGDDAKTLLLLLRVCLDIYPCRCERACGLCEEIADCGNHRTSQPPFWSMTKKIVRILSLFLRT